ncbi:MAG: amino acid adenylation domain-containing protein [Vicinamibacterales bacterium]
MSDAAAAPIDVPAPGAERERYVFPASFSQQRLFYLDQATGDAATYNIAKAFVLDGAFDIDAFRGALQDLVCRHESLRTTFRIDGRGPVQIVAPPGEVPLSVVDLRDRGADERMREAQRLLTADAKTAFDLARGPLFRVTVVAMHADRHAIGLTAHHIILDGWSLAVLRRDLAALYAARCAGRVAQLPDLPIQYADFAIWERAREASGCWAPLLDYWREQLRGLPPRLELPTDFARPHGQVSRGGRVMRDLPRPAHQAVKQLANAADATPFMVVLAAFAAFLHRCTGASDIGLGTPVAGRDRVELEQVAGLFVNTVVLRARVDGASTFRTFIGQVKETALDAFRHQEVPFDHVVRAVEPPRVPGVPPLFQVMFAFNTPDSPGDSTADLGGAALDTHTGTAKYDLTLSGSEGREGMRLRLEYDSQLFLPATAERLLRTFAVFLTAAVADPTCALEALPWMDAAESADAVASGTGALRAYSPDEPIHVRVERQASRRPGAIAIEDGELRVSYADLDRRAEAMAATLGRAGVGRGSLVVVCMPRGAAMIAACLGVLKTGAAYVPLDSSQPAARLRLMLDDASPSAIVTTQLLAGQLPTTTHVICMEDVGAHRDGADAQRAVVGGGDGAYVIYTSGSTGTPKGVVVPHRAVARLVVNTDYISIREDDRVAQASNASFDAATFEIWGALINGATLVHLSADDVSSPGRLAERIATSRIGILFVTTAVFNAVARHDAAAFGPLRALLFGGEAVDVESVRRVLNSRPPRSLIHVYGPTESTTFATAHVVAGVPVGARTVPIGCPIANTNAHVLDATGRVVPDGIVGELYLGGDGLALGYHRQPELTAERFVVHPFGAGRLYRTGDRCRRLPGGDLEYVGRADRQIKLRGFRIEPAEIEAALAAAPGVERAIVEAVEDGEGGRRLVAYVVPVPGAGIAAASLRAALRRSLPLYMVPSAFVFAADLPLNVNGKIDRERLACAGAGREEPRAIARPRDPLEAKLVRIWEDVLGVSPIGITDDFFDVGGHSLLAAAIIERVRLEFDRTVPVSRLLQCPTIEAFATALSAHVYTAGGIIGLRPAGRLPPLFFFHGDLNGGGLYCSPLARLLDPERPFYAVAPIGHDGSHTACSIEQMAAAHIDAIRRERAHGPYVLGGHCNGALVAFETARRLRAAGEEVLGVVLVQPSAVEPRLASLDRLVRGVAGICGMDEARRVSLFLRTCGALGAIRRQSGAARLQVIMQKVRRALVRDGNHVGPPRPAAARGQGGEAGADRIWRHDPELWTRYNCAVAAYVPRWQNVPLHLLMAAPVGPKRVDPTRGWGRAAPRVVLQPIAGDHRTCLTEELGSLAAALEAALRALRHGA